MRQENNIQLIGHYGGDETHACSAWTSTGRAFLDEIEEVEVKTPIFGGPPRITKEMRPRRERIPALLKMLATPNERGCRHTSPFEKSAIHFLVTADIASHIHTIKHRIAVSVNGESARYRELKDKWYVPNDWPEDAQKLLDEHCLECYQKYHSTILHLIDKGFTRKRAKESARFFLPYASQMNFDVQFNFLSLIHFENLRNEGHAQDEIHDIAHTAMLLVAMIPGQPFKHSIDAWGYGRYNDEADSMLQEGVGRNNLGMLSSKDFTA